MSRKTTPETAAQITAMRAARYSIPMISERTGVSLSTVKRILARHQQAVGTEPDLDLVEHARDILRAQFASDEALRTFYDGVLADTVYHIETAREVANEALRHLKATDTRDAALVFRALAAHATTLKAHVDVIKAIAPPPELIDELPELHVVSISDEEVREIRRAQQLRDEEFELAEAVELE